MTYLEHQERLVISNLKVVFVCILLASIYVDFRMFHVYWECSKFGKWNFHGTVVTCKIKENSK